MLRRLAEFKLGICMPHIHDETTGEMQTLPEDMIQMESGLKVSFRAAQETADQTDRFLPVGWAWRGGAAAAVAACEMIREEGPGDSERCVKHKM